MHIEYINKNRFNIYIYDKQKVKKIEDIKKEPEPFFKNLFLTLKNKYKVHLEGLYSLELYICKYYGIIIEISKIVDEFYQKYMEGVDLKIKINEESEVIYELEDILIINSKENISIFNNNGTFYLKYNSKPLQKEYFKILEHSKVVYGEKMKKIMKTSTQFIRK